MKHVVRVAGQQRAPKITAINGTLQRTRFQQTEWASFDRAVVDEVDFSGMSIRHFVTSASVFTGCDFSSARFASGFFGVGPNSSYVECSFERADLRSIEPGVARFERCVFDGAKIVDWPSDAAEFVDCKFATEITDSRFAGRPWGPFSDSVQRDRNEFAGNDFSEAVLNGTSFVFGIAIDKQQWPEDARYVRLDRWQERVRRVTEVVTQWPVGPERRDAETLLQLYRRPGYLEQTEIFEDRYIVGRSEGVRRFWELMENVV